MAMRIMVETNFLVAAFGLPYQQRNDAIRLWERYIRGEFTLYVPFLCFQEARGVVLDNLPVPSHLEKLGQYFRGVSDGRWYDKSSGDFLDALVNYVRKEQSGGVDSRLADVANRIGDGVIHGQDRIFASMPITVDHDLHYNDHLILASILYQSTLFSETDEVYFCTTDRHLATHTGSGKLRPVLSSLYGDHRIQFLQSFIIPE